MILKFEAFSSRQPLYDFSAVILYEHWTPELNDEDSKNPSILPQCLKFNKMTKKKKIVEQVLRDRCREETSISKTIFKIQSRERAF